MPLPPFAPPFLKAGRLLIGQTANILLFLGDRLKLVVQPAADRMMHVVRFDLYRHYPELDRY